YNNVFDIINTLFYNELNYLVQK
ncbi:MAG: hypothetical protein QG649_747, partial [Patescibacteria group bacterium]|nr:hypothetical protein [Patescibacteria group bacterium]